MSILINPLAESGEERRDHVQLDVELCTFGPLGVAREINETDPADAGDFLAGLGGHGGFGGDAGDDVEFDSLFFDLEFDKGVGDNEGGDVVSCFLLDLSSLTPVELVWD
jgi:hypothetical protein